MKDKRMIFVVGETSGGKDTVQQYMYENYGLKPVCSYTTRDKRVKEREGVEHYFISDAEMQRILEEENVLAYTKIEDKTSGVKGYEYCATVEGLKDAVVYIIDPNGVAYFKENAPDIELCIIYVTASYETRKERSVGRDSSKLKAFEDRVLNESSQFNAFADEEGYDYKIVNDEISLEDLYSKVDKILVKEHFIVS